LKRLQTLWLDKPDHTVDGTAANLRKATELVDDCVNFRRREGQAVATYLQELAN
jgi:hypothetical protein